MSLAPVFSTSPSLKSPECRAVRSPRRVPAATASAKFKALRPEPMRALATSIMSLSKS